VAEASEGEPGGIRSRPMKIRRVTETNVRATVNYEVRTNADRLREDYA
jgi:hypothetical protein